MQLAVAVFVIFLCMLLLRKKTLLLAKTSLQVFSLFFFRVQTTFMLYYVSLSFYVVFEGPQLVYLLRVM